MSPASSKRPQARTPEPYPARARDNGQATHTPPASILEPKPRPAARIALAHDWLVGLRGGEVVLDAIARTIHRTPGLRAERLYTLFADRDPLTPTLGAIPTSVSGLGRSPRSARRWLLPCYPLAAAHLSRRLARDHGREPFDLLLSSSSVAAKAVRPPLGVPHLCYCHTPARYLWDQQPEYRSGHPLRAAGLALSGPSLRAWDRRSTAGVTHLLANSRFTADRIARCWERDATVVHPPIDTDFFTPDPAQPRQEFWLIVSALEPYKRVELAIDAARSSGHPLRIVGTGSQLATLRARAADAPAITFEGRVSPERLRTLYRTARCLLFPQVEDFGIAAAEAQACGCPVVTRRRSGAAEIVLEDTTGVFMDEASADAIVRAVAALPEGCHERCRTNAERFGELRFMQEMGRQIREQLGSPG